MYLALSGNVLHRQLYHWIGLFIALLHLKTEKNTYKSLIQVWELFQLCNLKKKNKSHWALFSSHLKVVILETVRRRCPACINIKMITANRQQLEKIFLNAKKSYCLIAR